MPTQHIYITDENYEKLKQEENMSRLINSLLSEYYVRITEQTMEDLNAEESEIMQKAALIRDKKENMAHKIRNKIDAEKRREEERKNAKEREDLYYKQRRAKRKEFDRWIEHNYDKWKNEGIDFERWLKEYDEAKS